MLRRKLVPNSKMGMVKEITKLTQMMGQVFSIRINPQVFTTPCGQNHMDREFAMHPTQQVVVTHPNTHEHRAFATNHVQEYEPIEILPSDY